MSKATVKQGLFDFRDRLRGSNPRNMAAVFAVMVSVQGIVIAGQFLIAFSVTPQQLGLIRWLESAFAVALLASSCGMPSIAFRQAALCTGPEARLSLLARAGMLTSLAVGIVLLLGIAASLQLDQVSTSFGWMALLAMAGALWPANVARVGVAIIQGNQLTKLVWGRLLVFSMLAVGGLFAATWSAGVNGWIACRYVVEFGLTALVLHALLPGGAQLGHILTHGLRDLRGLLWIGSTANFAFLIRSVSDNLPILLLKAGQLRPEELGWYGFANLAIYLPTLLLSVLMQDQLPTLVQSAGEAPSFSRRLSELQFRLLYGAAIGACLIFAFATFLHWQLMFNHYSSAAWPLFILGASLPFKAIILTAGAAAVAHGRYAISSVLALVEILVVSIVSWCGLAIGATEMALAVFGASLVSVFPAFALIHACQKPAA